MITIKFNEVEGTLLSFNKNTYFSEGTMSGNLNCEVENINMNALQSLGDTPITSMSIKSDDTIIYNIDVMYARLNTINEYLVDNRIRITLNIDLIQPQSQQNENNT